MDAFVTATAEAAVERAQTSAAAGVRIKIGAHFDDTADGTVFLGKQQCSHVNGSQVDPSMLLKLVKLVASTGVRSVMR